MIDIQLNMLTADTQAVDPQLKALVADMQANDFRMTVLVTDLQVVGTQATALAAGPWSVALSAGSRSAALMAGSWSCNQKIGISFWTGTNVQEVLHQQHSFSIENAIVNLKKHLKAHEVYLFNAVSLHSFS